MATVAPGLALSYNSLSFQHLHTPSAPTGSPKCFANRKISCALQGPIPRSMERLNATQLRDI